MIIFGDDGMRHLMHENGTKEADHSQRAHKLVGIFRQASRLARDQVRIDFLGHCPADEKGHENPAGVSLHLETEEMKQRYALEGHPVTLYLSHCPLTLAMKIIIIGNCSKKQR